MSSFWAPTNYSYYWRPTYQPELYHHGIKGQKWGIRRFQNYPKGYRGKGRFAGAVGEKEKEIKYRNQWDHSETKTMMTVKRAAVAGIGTIMIAAGAASSVIDPMTLPYGAINVLGGAASIKSVVDSVRIGQKGKEFDERTKDLKTDSKTGLKLKDPSKTWTVEEDLKEVNPTYGDPVSQGGNHNCVLCTFSYDLRRRGYDVAANRAVTGWLEKDFNHWYPDLKMTKETRSTKRNKEANEAYVSKIVSDLQSTGKNSRGIICTSWLEGGGHAMAYEVKKGEVHVYDPQSGKEEKNLTKLFLESKDYSYGRLDNIKPDPKTIKEVTRR